MYYQIKGVTILSRRFEHTYITVLLGGNIGGEKQLIHVSQNHQQVEAHVGEASSDQRHFFEGFRTGIE